MTTYMRDDERGNWEETTIDGTHVEWRRRSSVAGEHTIDGGSGWVIDISLNGAPPHVQPDFNEGIPDRRQELELRVRQIKAAAGE